MVVLPKGLTATKYPGYFWDTKKHKLYSIKIGGVLKEMPITKPNSFNYMRGPGYRVSHKGVRRVLSIEYLKKLVLEDSEVSFLRTSQ